MIYTPDRQINPDSFYEKETETEPCQICGADVDVTNPYSFGQYDCVCKECFIWERTD